MGNGQDLTESPLIHRLEDHTHYPHIIEGVIMYSSNNEEVTKYIDFLNGNIALSEEEAFRVMRTRNHERKKKEDEEKIQLKLLEDKSQKQNDLLLNEIKTLPINDSAYFYTISTGAYEIYDETIMYSYRAYSKQQFCRMYNAAIIELGGGVFEDSEVVAEKMCEMFDLKMIENRFHIETRWSKHRVIDEQSIDNDDEDNLIEHN